MKTRIIKSILVLLLVFVAMPMKAQDYLKICFKDGHTERHFMQLVENISVTKYDLEGNQHSDYQMQQIVMADTTYSYYLSDIESMSFTKVDEEQLKSRVESVQNSLMPIFEQSSTVEDMEACIDEIKNVEGVEEVCRAGTDIVVKIRDWQKVFFKFPLVQDYDSYFDNLSKALKKIKGQVPVKADGSKIRVCIAFQMIDDPRFDPHEVKLRKLYDELDGLGFDVNFIPNEKTGEILDFDFYKERIFDYDIVVLQTHGGYHEGKHSFFTGIESSYIAGAWDYIQPDFLDFDEIGHGISKSGSFKTVSEDFIRKSKNSFKGTGPHIVFMAACSSLEGDDELSHVHNGETESFRGSDAVAQIFFDKGADVYMGYDKSTAGMGFAANAYFHNMLKGCSQEAAFYYLDENEYKHETRTKWKASLIDLVNPNSIKTREYFLFKPHTDEISNETANSEYKQNKTVKVSGSATLIDFDNEIIKPGFTVTYNDPVEHTILVNAEIEPVCYENKVEFNATLSFLQPGRTYYYRAYTYDGINHNYGNTCSFKIEESSSPTYTSCPDNNHPHLIDLGLPSGTKWACCNVGASKPEDYGKYFAWGETAEKDDYDWSTYLYGTYDIYDHEDDFSHLIDIGNDIAGTQFDAATANWGSPWMMPSIEQIRELVDNCTTEKITVNGKNGRSFTGKNGASIFLPFMGIEYKYSYDNEVDKEGYYWSSTLVDQYPCGAWDLRVSNYHWETDGANLRCYGLGVRPVRKN